MDSLDDVKIIIQNTEFQISEIIKKLPIISYKDLIDYIFKYNFQYTSENILSNIQTNIMEIE